MEQLRRAAEGFHDPDPEAHERRIELMSQRFTERCDLFTGEPAARRRPVAELVRASLAADEDLLDAAVVLDRREDQEEARVLAALARGEDVADVDEDE